MAMIDSECDRYDFEQLFLDNKLKAFRTAYKILHNEESAEDAVSEAFLKIAECFQKIHNLTSHEMSRYVVITVRNTAINMLKKESKSERVAYNDELAYDEIPQTDYSYLHDCVEQLSDTDREILYLRFTLELDYREIGTALGISDTAARQRVRYAKSKLTKLLEKEENYE
jgi:RNA polymerase sigma-70 factor (ECF subfamily)